VLSPTLTHAPFAGAVQRVYMSATLGDDGDLERCFGVKNITRLPAPEGWDKRGTGRRLVLFPELSSKTENDGLDVLEGLLKEVKRSLILVPNNRLRDVFKEKVKDIVTVFVGTETEDNLELFRSHPGPAALILANRYDGIDFPGEECRSDVVYGFPLGADLQEMFLTQRLKAFSITQDRVRTRVTQAMGRCTRDESDYAIVLILGADLVKWFCTEENVRGMHPELQAEVAFGLENSRSNGMRLRIASNLNVVRKQRRQTKPPLLFRRPPKQKSILPTRVGMDCLKSRTSTPTGLWLHCPEAALCVLTGAPGRILESRVLAGFRFRSEDG